MSQELINLIRSRSKPLEPLPTGVACRLEPPGSQIKAVLFDVYGTLFISGSGDISLAAEQDAEHEMRAALSRAGLQLLSDDYGFHEAFLARVRGNREAMQRDGVMHPEVDIREVWREFLNEQRERGLLAGMPDESGTVRLAIDFECAVNPVWPMPGAVATLSRLRDQGLQMGLVSNAQFFTPLLFEALMGQTAYGLGIRSDLCAWSYQFQRGKPEPGLFTEPLGRLGVEGIRPDEVLVVGNDMLNDIHPAAGCGTATALFAGDRRSLRLRLDDARCQGLVPSITIACLSELTGWICPGQECRC